MVGLVIVSHSPALAEGVAELARQMGGEDVAVETAGGLDDGEIGTDAARVMAAVERARSPEGVLVMVDLGSAVMSAELALEMLDSGGGPVLLSDAPLVEGAVAAAATARGGASLEAVAKEARGALAMKAGQLPDAPVEDAGDLRATVRVENPHGLHMRPAARLASEAGSFDAKLSLRNLTRGTGPADAASLTAVALLGVRAGDELEIAAGGAQAQAALDALLALAAENFGESLEDGATPAASAGTAAHAAGVAGGLAIGPARRLAATAPDVDGDVPEGPPDTEWARLTAARAAVGAELAAEGAQLRRSGHEAEATIFTAQALLLDDDALLGPARAAVDGGAPATAAFRTAGSEAAAAFRATDNDYLRERAVDVDDVVRRVLGKLSGVAALAPSAPGIVVADQLTASEVLRLDPESVWGVVTARGSSLDHASIVAGAVGIPMVVGAGPDLLALAEGTTVAIDGGSGAVEVDPGEERVRELERRRDAERAARADSLERAAAPVALADGRVIEVEANVANPAEARAALAHGADGVGLLRTEFLFLDRDTPPSEDEQVAVLSEIAQALEGRPVVVRTLDAGADKPVRFIPQEPEVNPYLGRRGLRLSLAAPEIFSTQLRAIVRAAEEHPLAVMFPMVSTVEELLAARQLLTAASATDELEVGMMIEVPAAALRADAFAPHVDFFSIGTNDLSQYTMAAERGNPALAGLLDQALEPVLALVALVTSAAAAHGCWVSVCGELAGNPEAAPALVALGVSKLSMSASRIPRIKDLLRGAELRGSR